MIWENKVFGARNMQNPRLQNRGMPTRTGISYVLRWDSALSDPHSACLHIVNYWQRCRLLRTSMSRSEDKSSTDSICSSSNFLRSVPSSSSCGLRVRMRIANVREYYHEPLLFMFTPKSTLPKFNRLHRGSRTLNNSDVECRVLWNRLPEFAKDQ